MKLTQEKFEELISLLLEKAKTNRMKYGYSGAEKFAACALVIGPQCEHGVLPTTWKDDHEKRIVMHALSESARATGAQGIVLINDVRWTDDQRFSAHFKIPQINDIGFEAWTKRYTEIRMKYGGDMGKLPREVWSEAVTVAGKGPKVAPIARMAHYVEGENDSVVWIKLDKPEGADIMMLPDWWETTIQ